MHKPIILLVIYLASSSFAMNAQHLSWAVAFGSTGQSHGYGIAIDSGGNIYTTGSYSGTTDFDPGAGVSNLVGSGDDIYISKLSPSGANIWAKRIGSSNSDAGTSIALDISGNIFTTGRFEFVADFDPGPATCYLASNGSADVFLSKLDSSGNFIWAKSFGSPSTDGGRCIATDRQGNVYISGNFGYTVDFDPDTIAAFMLTSAGNSDAFICKFNASGNFVWAKRFGSTLWDNGNSIAVDDSGNVYGTGLFNDTVDFDPGSGVSNLISAGDDDIFVVKLDPGGNLIWAKRIGGSRDDIGQSLALDPSTNILITGSFWNTVDFDPGSGVNYLNGSGQKIFILKLDSAGNFVWAGLTGGTGGGQSGYSIFSDFLGNVYSAGNFYGTSDFDPGAGTFNLVPVGAQDYFICKLDPSGNFAWARSMGSGGSDYNIDIAVDLWGNVVTTGDFWGTVDFDPGPGVYNLIMVGSGFDAFVQKLSSLPTETRDEIQFQKISLFPNPATSHISVLLPAGITFADITITDLSGKVLLQQNYQTSGIVDLETSALEDGLYCVRVQTAGFVAIRKFVIVHNN